MLKRSFGKTLKIRAIREIRGKKMNHELHELSRIKKGNGKRDKAANPIFDLTIPRFNGLTL